MPNKKKGKAGLVRIPSSDLPSQEDGWVEMQTYLKTKHLPYIWAFKPEALQKPGATIEEHEEALLGVYRVLAILVSDWDWKDPSGEAYPKPDGNQEVFGELRPSEFNWLIGKANETIVEQATIPKRKESASPTS